tara:strand:+ start:228 stop:347 length:120 start_codon:yes stop_codon:yes gene_type:complete
MSLVVNYLKDVDVGIGIIVIGLKGNSITNLVQYGFIVEH